MAEKRKCEICGAVQELCKHVRMHGLTTKQYYDKFIRKENEGFCLTCGKETRFTGIDTGYVSHCSNVCIGKDRNIQEYRSRKAMARSPEEKAETRRKQIETWTKTMGEDWKDILARKAVEGFDKKHPGNTGGPFASKEVRKKCEKTWGTSSPTKLESVKEKISLSTKIQMKTQSPKQMEETFQRIKEKCPYITERKSRKEYVFKCPKCEKETIISALHVYRAIKRNFFGHLCEHCFARNATSFAEQELFEYLKTIYKEDINFHERTILEGKEIDAYIPELKIGFEYDGTYWHADPRFYSSNFVIKGGLAKDVWKKDKEKDELCKSKGIKLFRVKEYDWLNDNINIKQKISEVINDA